MKTSLFFILSFSLNSALSQLTLFTKLCNDSLCKLDISSEIEASTGSFSCTPSQIAMDELCLEYTAELSRVSSKKYGGLCKSLLLQQMANFASISWRGTQYSDRRRWGKLEKRFKRTKRNAQAGFNLITCISFRINLTESKSKEVYHDAEDGTSVFNLFYGEKPSKAEKKDENFVSKPVRELNLEELIFQMDKALRKNVIYSDLKRGTYSSVGVRIMLDEKSINRNNTLPTARVVIFFGAKRLQRVKLKKERQMQ